MKRFSILIILIGFCHLSLAQNNTVIDGKKTTVKVNFSEVTGVINPMIYGQMLEDCNDGVIYGGIVNKQGKENKGVTKLLRPLSIPVMRWPAGTAIYDYEWKKGIGPERKAEREDIWHGYEYYTFGTDEFIKWCRNLEIEPYINIAMGNNNTFRQSLGDALDWLEYVNGDVSTPYGSLRAKNGHGDPYGVKYWCLGNENYLPCKFHKSETAGEYASQLGLWSKTIKELYPDVCLLGVGHTREWNKTVIEKCGRDIDFLTLHFYFNSKVDGKELLNPDSTLFSAAMLEANLRNYIADAGNRIRFSIDEWNNRHAVNIEGKYIFTRGDDRRQYDVSTTATVLNVFIRNSPDVAMANYIFPVNGHGLIKTIDDSHAYAGLTYHVFDLYRKYMKGRAMSVSVLGPGIRAASIKEMSTLVGDVDKSTFDIVQDLCYVDAACSIDDEGIINIALVSRSYDKTQTVNIEMPDGYHAFEAWSLESEDVTYSNTRYSQKGAERKAINENGTRITLSPCGLIIVRCRK